MKKFYLLLILFIIFLISCERAQKEKISAYKPSVIMMKDEELEKWKEEIKKEAFTIDLSQLQNPFITPKTYKLLSKKEELIPLELVGILNKGTIKYALLQDPAKKGYIVKRGDKVGKTIIKEISSEYIIIEEEEENIFGGITKKTRKITLKRREE